jgi:hypothetical protein
MEKFQNPKIAIYNKLCGERVFSYFVKNDFRWPTDLHMNVMCLDSSANPEGGVISTKNRFDLATPV